MRKEVQNRGAAPDSYCLVWAAHVHGDTLL